MASTDKAAVHLRSYTPPVAQDTRHGRRWCLAQSRLPQGELRSLAHVRRGSYPAGGYRDYHTETPV
jgi:hypothetical protein